MAEPKGILAMIGARPPDEDEGGDSDEGESPKARAMQEMAEAQESGDWEAMGHAFERAYKICAQRKGGGSEAEESSGDEYEA